MSDRSRFAPIYYMYYPSPDIVIYVCIWLLNSNKKTYLKLENQGRELLQGRISPGEHSSWWWQRYLSDLKPAVSLSKCLNINNKKYIKRKTQVIFFRLNMEKLCISRRIRPVRKPFWPPFVENFLLKYTIYFLLFLASLRDVLWKVHNTRQPSLIQTLT